EGLLTRGSPLRHLPGLAASGLRRRSNSPHSGGTVPDSHRVPLPRAVATTLSWPNSELAGAFALAAPDPLGGRHLHLLLHLPSPGTGLGTWDTILRKGAHMTEYAILGLLLLRALGRELPALAIGIAYAISDELHQHFVRGRHASPIDVLIDTVGLAIGIFIV